MSKKRKDKRPSARGHVEDNVLRWREEKRLIRIDKKGRPIHADVSEIFDRSKLAKSLIDSGGTAPPITHQPETTPPPDNVTSFSKAQAKRDAKPAAQSGNEAEAIPPDKRKVSGTCKHGWLHNTSLAIDEFRSWSRRAKEFGIKTYGDELWWYDENRKCLSHPSLEDQRKRSMDGHKKLKFKKPPSIMHNPLLSPNEPESGGYTAGKPAHHGRTISWYNQRNRQATSVPLTPSGLPISMFTEGQYKPQPSNSSVVYTTSSSVYTKDWPFVKQPDKAANDSGYDRSVKVRRTPALNSIEHKMLSEVQWFINHVEPQNWPTHIHNFAHWKSGGPIPNTGAINKAAASREDRYKLLDGMYQGLSRDWTMIDSALTDAQSENNLLRQELKLTKQELDAEKQRNGLYEYDLAMRNGEPPDSIRESYENAIIKSKTPVPDDADIMLAQFNVFNSFVKCDGIEHAFARYVYGDPRLGDVIRDHADMKCNERQSAVQQRNLIRFFKEFSTHILSEIQAEYEKEKYDEYVNFWQTKYPLYLLHRQRRKMTAVRDPAREAVSYAAMARKAKPALHNKDSIYYSTVDRSRTVTSAVAKSLVGKVKPTRCIYNNPACVEHDTRKSWAQPKFKGMSKYEQWWAERLDCCEVHYHESTSAGRVKIGIVKAYNKTIDILNTPVDPATRKRKAATLQRIREEQHELDEKREQRKERKQQRKADREYKRKLRNAYSLAH